MFAELKQRCFEIKENATLGMMTGILMVLVLLYLSVFVLHFFQI